MSKNLIYANADEFHVKSTLVYTVGSDDRVLYWDPEFTKPVYSDELERLFLAGGMKIMRYKSIGSNLNAILSANVYTPGSDDIPSKVSVGEVDYHSTLRPIEDSLPSAPVVEEEGGNNNA